MPRPTAFAHNTQLNSPHGRTTKRIRQVAPDSKLVRVRWLLDNGAHEVELVDDSEATWEAYCAELVAKLKK